MYREPWAWHCAHDVERAFVFEGQESHDGTGWVVRVDGELVASGASIGALEESLRRWLVSRDTA